MSVSLEHMLSRQQARLRRVPEEWWMLRSSLLSPSLLRQGCSAAATSPLLSAAWSWRLSWSWMLCRQFHT